MYVRAQLLLIKDHLELCVILTKLLKLSVL